MQHRILFNVAVIGNEALVQNLFFAFSIFTCME